ncbi:15551_t:CDS:2, partial [Dentiscutata heterogama]
SEKCINGTAIYRTNSNKEEFRELTYKDFVTQKSLITELEKNSIALMVGRYVFEDTEYLTLIQTVPISTFNNGIEITLDDLPYLSSLLLFSAPVIPNSTFPITNLIGAKKMLHIIATDIEWNYVSNEQTSNNLNKAKAKAQGDINNHLEGIEEKYAKLNSFPSRKRQHANFLPASLSKTQKTELQNNNSKPQNDKSPTDNFLHAINQIKNTGTTFQNNNINNNHSTTSK